MQELFLIFPDGSHMPIDYSNLPERFFSLFEGVPQKDLIVELRTQQAQASRWKSGKEKIPWAILEYAVDNKKVTWDWLLEGIEPKHRVKEKDE